MDDAYQISQLADYIRSSFYHNKSNTFSLSNSIWWLLFSSFELLDGEEGSSSFHVKQSSNIKNEFLRDLKFLSNFVQQTKIVKLYEDNKSANPIDISRFRSLFSIEFNKVDVNLVKGIQKLRSQLQKLVCHRTSNCLGEVLSSCGGDESNGYCWNELKELIFTNNNITEIDHSIEYTPWLHTLDLSHNQITNIEALNCLNNLKYLNLSYNKLETVPHFKGYICSRLQNLILKNNFIENISGLQSLTNVWVLDLSNNCLIDHKIFSSLSHLATLQWLNLENNPLTFHPNHRNKTASYLHANTVSTHVVLDHVALSKTEDRLIGSLHPVQTQNYSDDMTESLNVSADRTRKVRHVTIEEETSSKLKNITSLPSLPQPYLETKKQIENLHEQYGESWLNSHSGLLVQNVLGLEASSLPVSSSPYEADFTIHSSEFYHSREITLNKSEEVPFLTAYDTTNPETDNDNNSNSVSETSDDDLDEIESEENLFLVSPKNESEDIFLVITKNHISEKESSTSKERVRWHLKSIINCVVLEDSTEVQLDFDTMRKDRQQRVYVFEEQEVAKFVQSIKMKMTHPTDEPSNNVKYQCMKCSAAFSQIKKETVLGETSVKCPVCDSTLIIETS